MLILESILEDAYFRIHLESSQEEQASILYYSKDTLYIADDMESPFRSAYTYEVIEFGPTTPKGKIRLNKLGGGVCDNSIIATYAFEFSGGELLLTTISDECPERDLSNFKYQGLFLDMPAIRPDSFTYLTFENKTEGILDYQDITRNWDLPYEGRPVYEIYDVYGFRRDKGEIWDPRGAMDISYFDKRVYFLSVFTTEGWKTVRFVNFDLDPNIEENSNIDISIEPNTLTNGLFQYNYNGNATVWYRIYDSDGNFIKNDMLLNGELPFNYIDLSSEPSGTYYLIAYEYDQSAIYPLVKYDLSTSIEDIRNIGFTIHPNPSETGIFQYTYDGNDRNASYQIYDGSGRLIKTDTLLSEGLVDLSMLPSSIYFMIVSDSSGKLSIMGA